MAEGGAREPGLYAAIKQAAGWRIGWIEKVPGIDCQERPRAELLETLRITLEEALALNRREARAAAGDGFAEISIAVCSERSFSGTSGSAVKWLQAGGIDRRVTSSRPPARGPRG
jgi:hypothetical protein